MTKYLWDKFAFPQGGKAYGEGWDRIFGKAAESQPAPEPVAPCPCESGKPFEECHGQEPE